MRFSKIALFLVVCLLASCQKDHYNLGNVHGVNANGEVLLPLASGDYSIDDLMQRFQIDSLIECNSSGDMVYEYYYERFGAVCGDTLLRFKDWNYHEQFVIENLQGGWSHPVDTVVSMSQTILFETDHIHVMSAAVKSGRFDINLTANVGGLSEVVVTSPNLRDADGHELRFTFHPQMGPAGFSFEGMNYETDEANTLQLDYEFHLVVNHLQVPEVAIDAYVSTTGLALSEMRGFVDPYESRDRIDTTFSLFPGNMSGEIKVDDALITLRELNTFGLSARLEVDTALVWGEHIPPYSIFSPMPVRIDLPPQDAYCEVYHQPVSGWIDTHMGHALASSTFTVNSDGVSDMVTIYDTCNIDIRVDVSIPFSFNVNNLKYMDTVNMHLDEIEMPELIEELALEITFNSTLPFELGGKFMLYDSKTERVTDVLLDEPVLIAPSYDGQPSTSSVEMVITDDRVEHALQSDRIILCFDLDTDMHDVSLNANQSLSFFAKARVKYDGVVEPDN